MPIYRCRDGKKTTKLYLEEIKRLHSTKDLLADLTLNEPLIVAYAAAHDILAGVCAMWPIPEPKERKAKPEYTAAEMAQPSPRYSTNDPVHEESEARAESPAEIAASSVTEAARDF